MLTRTALRFVNHVLTDAAWARIRLQPFAGQTARLSVGQRVIPVEISSSGLFKQGNANASAAVSIALPADAPLRALADRPSLFSAAHISGSAEFAEALGFIFRNLRWDVEEDLAQLLGDVAAHRLLLGGRHLVSSQRHKTKNFALNLAEYLTEENPMIARRADIVHFCSSVDAIHDACSRFEMRIQRLESR